MLKVTSVKERNSTNTIQTAVKIQFYCQLSQKLYCGQCINPEDYQHKSPKMKKKNAI